MSGRTGRNGAVITFDGETPCFDGPMLCKTSEVQRSSEGFP